MKTKASVYFMKKEGCDSFGSSHFLSRAENYPLCKAVVDHNQERIKARGGGKICDEITGQLLEWMGGGGVDGVKGYHGVRVDLGLLTISASFDVLSYKLDEARPPIVSCHELGVLRNPGWPAETWSWHRETTSRRRVPVWNIHVVLVGKKVVMVLKIGEV